MQTFLRVSTMLCAMVCGFFLQAGETRTWTDSTGKFTVQATLERIDGDKIVIKKDDGKFVTLSLAKLSKKDRDFVSETLEKDNPFAGGSETLESPETPGPAGPVDEKTVFSVRGKPLRLQQGTEGGGDAPTEWSCPADAAPVPKTEKAFRNISFHFGKRDSGRTPKEAGQRVCVRDGKFRVLSVYNIDFWDPGKGDKHSLVFLGDLESGHCDRLVFPEKLTLLDVSPDGSKAAIKKSDWEYREVEKSAKHDYLHIVRFDGAEPVSLAVYEPFGEDVVARDKYDTSGEIKWGTWIDEKRVILQSKKNRLIALNVEDGTIPWKISKNSYDVDFSPGRRYCLTSSFSDDAVLLDTQTGQPIGKLRDAPTGKGLNDFNFSPDGKKIAGYANGDLHIWDATTGKKEEPFFVGFGHFSVDWTDEKHVLVGDRFVDTEIRSLVWVYGGMPRPQFFAGRIWFNSGSGEEKKLVSVVLPHESALAVAEFPDEKRYSVRPGMAVALKIDDSIKENRNEIEEKIKTVLEENGLVLQADAPVVLNLSVTREKEEAAQYGVGHPLSPFLRSGGTEIKFRPYLYKIEFRNGDKVLWSLQHKQGPPNNISLDEVKKSSLQKVVDDALAKPDCKEWFENVNIPKKIPNPEVVGTSFVSGSGIRDM